MTTPIDHLLPHVGAYNPKTFKHAEFADSLRSGDRTLDTLITGADEVHPSVGALEQHFTTAVPAANMAPEFQELNTKFANNSGITKFSTDAKEIVAQEEALKKSQGAAYKGMDKDNAAKLKTLGGEGHTQLNQLEQHVHDHHELASKHLTDEKIKIDEALRKKAITAEEAGTFKTALEKEHADLTKGKEARLKLIEAERAELEKHSGIKNIKGAGVAKSAGSATAAAEKAAAGTTKSFGEIISKASKGELFADAHTFGDVKALRAEEFGKMGIGKRTAAGIAGNLGKGGYAKKGLAVAALGSTVYFGSGLLADLGRVVGIVPKKRDANGEEVSTGFTDIAIDAGGTAASLAVAAIGGKAHALGH